MPTPEGARVGRGPARTGRWEGVPPHAPPDPSAGAGETDERSGLRRVAAAVVARTDPTEALNLAAAEVAALAGAEQGFVFRLVGDRVEIAGADGIEESPVGAVHGMLPGGVIPEVVRTRLPVRVEGRLRPLGRENSAIHWIRPVYRGGIGAPVFVGTDLWGVLVAGTTRDEPFPQGAEGRLAYFAEIAGIAIGNAEANERLARLAMSDPLTGLANHRAFRDALDAEVERARRHSRPLALAVIDIDHFKSVNDTHGHIAGDQALVEVAARLTGSSRRGDVLARVGGEEFAWLLPETDLAGARRVAERARRAVAARPVGAIGRVTVSIGLAELAQATGGTDLHRRADRALYAAKRAGRDRSVVHADPADPGVTAPPVEALARAVGPAARALSRALAAHDPAAAAHCGRVAALAARLADAAGWSPARVESLAEAALVHDIGTLAVPRAARPQGLHDEDPAVRGLRALAGAEVLRGALREDQVAWVRGQAERWDGSGRPDGLAGAAIPEGARILAVADGWDLLTAGGEGDAAAARRELAAAAGSRYCPGSVAHLTAVLDAGAR
jgi:diguanylate cyclase (GGDEF)-like protein